MISPLYDDFTRRTGRTFYWFEAALRHAGYIE